MPDGLDDLLGDNSTDSGQGQKGGGLRAQLEAVLAQNKALTEQLASVQANDRARSLDSLFEKHSIPALARDLFPKDAEPSDEAATALVAKYGALWGAQAQEATTPADQQAATNAAQQFAANASAAPVAPLTEEAYRAKFAQANSRDELLKQIAEFEPTVTTGMGV